MSLGFSANQFDKAFQPKRLGNWELPKKFPPRPRQRKGSTKFIANERGHLFDGIRKSDSNPWGNFRGTHELPARITRRFADEYNDRLVKSNLYKKYQLKDRHPCEENNNHETIDLEYVPGDLTPLKDQLPSRQSLIQQKYLRDNGLQPELKLDRLYLGDHDCETAKCRSTNLTPPLPLTAALATPLISPPLNYIDTEKAKAEAEAEAEASNLVGDFSKFSLANPDITANMPRHSITEKPNERCPSPIIPVSMNFELAKRMHDDNLEHQPLPDCVADIAYRKLQIQGGPAGLALDVSPISTGVGVRTHNAGPTHCTKAKVYRPKTCNVGSKSRDNGYRPFSSIAGNGDSKKMGPMDLAICWDYTPQNPADEPKPPVHIDGSNDTAGPAVFNHVKTPRDSSAKDVGRSAGVFTSTLGEKDFFDKDFLRKKSDFMGRPIDRDRDDACLCAGVTPPMRAHSVSRADLDCPGAAASFMLDRHAKRYQSTPNVLTEADYRAMRDKYLPDTTEVGAPCKRPGFFRRARSRFCHKVAPDPLPLPAAGCCHFTQPRPAPCRRAAFRVGIPKYDAAGYFMSSDSGCSMGSHPSRVLVVPQPRNPYPKRNYDIETLVPPFSCSGGGAKEGGYPEHWRLASVYQHSYKRPEIGRRSLMDRIYK